MRSSATNQRLPESQGLGVDRSASAAALDRAKLTVAGGDSSSMRVLPYHPPLVAERGEGPWLYDLDGNRILDMNMAYGPLLFGHRADFVVNSIVRQVQDFGSQLGFPTRLTYATAELLQTLFPAMELMRFANSGTEAIASAIRLARVASGRQGIILCEGHYHGWSEAVFHRYHAPLEALGAEPGEPAMPGTAGMCGPSDAFMIPWNDSAALEHCLKRHPGKIGALIMEPVMGNAGVIPPKPGYLDEVRAITKQYGVVLIFDEVITGMRIAAGGAQQRYGVKPDITIVSKILGGGTPIAAFGASKAMFEPILSGQLFHGGVYSGNAMVLAAAYAVLTAIIEKGQGLYDQLERSSERLTVEARKILDKYGVPSLVQNVGAMISVFLTNQDVKELNDYRAVRKYGNFENFIKLEHALLDKGIYIHPNMFEPMFPSAVHGDAEIDEFLNRFEDSIRQCAMN